MVWDILVLANPTTKQHKETINECLQILPSSLATLLLFYLRILQLAFYYILWLVQEVTHKHKTYIFGYTFPKHSSEIFWSRADVNASLQKHISAFSNSLLGSLLYKVTTEILQKFFLLLTELHQLPNSLLDQQAQHHQQTSNTHYR